MKKTLFIFVAIALIATACTKSTYVDGTYKASYDGLDSHGWAAFVEFTITDDVISGADFDYLDANNGRKSEDAAYQERMYNSAYVLVGTDTVRTNPETYCPIIEANIESAEIVPEFEGIDAVAGATHSVENADALVEAALEAAMTGESMTITVVQPDPPTED